MRSGLVALAIAAFFVVPRGPSIAQDRPIQLEALPQASRDVLSAWLQRDCSVGVPQEELTRLRVISSVVQEALVEAYRQGPPPELERTYKASFSTAFDARQAALAREGARLFGRDDAARLLTVNRETYIRRRLEAARINYRTNAVLGLGVVGARGALPLLNQITSETGNPMREAALRSIEALREGQTLVPERLQ
jgi:hypothetical protein